MRELWLIYCLFFCTSSDTDCVFLLHLSRTWTNIHVKTQRFYYSTVTATSLSQTVCLRFHLVAGKHRRATLRMASNYVGCMLYFCSGAHETRCYNASFVCVCVHGSIERVRNNFNWRSILLNLLHMASSMCPTKVYNFFFPPSFEKSGWSHTCSQDPCLTMTRELLRTPGAVPSIACSLGI